MLSLDRRALFLDSLRPPDEYEFDRGIGTTFTLDLLTLIAAPVSLALQEISSVTEALDDPVLLLDSLQRHAERLTIFCQAGRIAVPKRDSRLYRFLEDMVVQVEAPGGGVFHPKIWLLRYLSEGRPPLYRLLCLSRNLTFDRSWDLILRLEGQLSARQRAYARNHPLGDFVRALPKLAATPIQSDRLDAIDLLQEEVRRVAFGVPEPFFEDNLQFRPLGIPGHRRLKLGFGYSRALAVSPFLSSGVLQQLTEQSHGHVLLSQDASLAEMKREALDRFSEVWVLDEMALQEPEEDPREAGEGEMPGGSEPTGLHAKLYVFDAGWNAHWLIGSANATNAAFRGQNVEFLVGLTGKKGRVGIDRVLGDEEEGSGLRSLLRPYLPGDHDVTVNPEVLAAESLADAVRTVLLSACLQGTVSAGKTDRFELTLRPKWSGTEDAEGDYDLRVWPVTMRFDRALDARPLHAGGQVVFEGLSLLVLTTFFAFHIKARVGNASHTLRFVLNLPVVGFPEGRDDRVLAALIEDRATFLRFLRMILAEERGLILEAFSRRPPVGRIPGPDGVSEGLDLPLLEELVRALSRSPEKIDRIARVVEALERTPEGKDVLPEGFDAIWSALVEAREVHA